MMTRCRRKRSLQKFAAAHASVHNHFNLERHIKDGIWFKENQQAALAEWRQLAAKTANSLENRDQFALV